MCSNNYQHLIFFHFYKNTGCTDDHKWTGAGLGDNTTRVDEFEAAVLRYMRENVAVVNMFLKQPYCELIMQDRESHWFSLVSNMGGILSLFLGFSFVSLLELLWYFLLICHSIMKSMYEFVDTKK